MKILQCLFIVVFLGIVSISCSRRNTDNHAVHENSLDDHDHHADQNQEHIHDDDCNDSHDHDILADHNQEHIHDDDCNDSHDHDIHSGHNHENTHDADHNGSHDHENDSDLIIVNEEWSKLIGVKTVRAAVMPLDELFTVPGRIIPHSDFEADVSAFVDASVNSIFVQSGDFVNAGDELICVTSPQIGLLRAEYEKAKAELELSKQELGRRRKLHVEKIVSDRQLQETELAFELKKVQFEYAKKKLTAVGVDDKQLANPPAEHSDAVGATLHIYSPLTGIITQRNVRKGQKISPKDKLFEIMDLSTVWCEADIYEKDIHRVYTGQKASLYTSAYPDKRFYGKIVQVESTLNRDTKTLKIRIEVENTNFELKPGMFASANIVTGRKDAALVIPKRAVLQDESLNIVYVKEGEGYHKHIVQLGMQSDQLVEVTQGIKLNDIVVTSGNYQIHSQSRMTGVDPHAGHVH